MSHGLIVQVVDPTAFVEASPRASHGVGEQFSGRLRSERAVADEVTGILRECAAGSPDAVDRLMPLVYNQLRALAAGAMANERSGHTLQPTALAHEAYMRLVGEQQVAWQDRAHFMAIAARCVRQILINHANARGAAKRGGDAQRVTIADASLPDGSWAEPVDALALEELLGHLAELHERQARVVELRFYGGLSVRDVSHILGVSDRTVENDWRFARAWLCARLSERGHE